jgi:glycine cleavage system H protein
VNAAAVTPGGPLIPDDLKYTSEHEWVRAGDGRVRIGITHYAQDALGDVVFVSLPEVGASVSSGESFGEVESTKSVSEIYAPVSGEVVARNEALESRPDLVNQDPYGEGWLVEIDAADADLSGLLDADAYRALTDAS